MESELAAAHPEITTYAGRGVDDPQASIALDLTPMGFHAFVRAPGTAATGTSTRPTTGAAPLHTSATTAATPAPEQRRAEGEVSALRDTVTTAQQAATDAGQPVNRRYFRLALTSDPSYAAYFGTDNVLAEKVTLINRVNEIYNDDLAVELRLVDAHREPQPRHRRQGDRGGRPVRRGAVLRALRRQRDAGRRQRRLLWRHQLLRRLDPGQEPHRARPAHRRLQLRRRPHRAGRQRWRHRLPRRHRRRATRAAAAPASRSRRATSSPSTTWPTSSATSSAATTPSTAPSAPAAATSPTRPSSRAPVPR